MEPVRPPEAKKDKSGWCVVHCTLAMMAHETWPLCAHGGWCKEQNVGGFRRHL